MAQGLIAPAVLLEDLDLVPSIHTVTHNHLQLQFQTDALFWPSWAPVMHVVYTHVCKQTEK